MQSHLQQGVQALQVFTFCVVNANDESGIIVRSVETCLER